LCENETGSFATKFCGKIKESELTSVDISRSLSNLVAVKQKEEIVKSFLFCVVDVFVSLSNSWIVTFDGTFVFYFFFFRVNL
jgi:hypothetical protein